MSSYKRYNGTYSAKDEGSFWQQKSKDRDFFNAQKKGGFYDEYDGGETGYTMPIDGAKHSLWHITIQGGRYTNRFGDFTISEEEFISKCREACSKFNKVIEEVIDDQCCKQPHIHMLIASRENDRGEQIITTRRQIRQLAKQLSNDSRGCSGCTHIVNQGSPQNCSNCYFKITRKQIKDDQHLENTKRYFERYRAAKEGRDLDEEEAAAVECEFADDDNHNRYACEICYLKDSFVQQTCEPGPSHEEDVADVLEAIESDGSTNVLETIGHDEHTGRRNAATEKKSEEQPSRKRKRNK